MHCEKKAKYVKYLKKKLTYLLEYFTLDIFPQTKFLNIFSHDLKNKYQQKNLKHFFHCPPLAFHFPSTKKTENFFCGANFPTPTTRDFSWTLQIFPTPHPSGPPSNWRQIKIQLSVVQCNCSEREGGWGHGMKTNCPIGSDSLKWFCERREAVLIDTDVSLGFFCSQLFF